MVQLLQKEEGRIKVGFKVNNQFNLAHICLYQVIHFFNLGSLVKASSNHHTIHQNNLKLNSNSVTPSEFYNLMTFYKHKLQTTDSLHQTQKPLQTPKPFQTQIYQLGDKNIPTPFESKIDPSTEQCLDFGMRKKLHQSKSQNFSLKQELSRLRKNLHQLQQSNSCLKTQIQQNLDQIALSHQHITHLDQQLQQSRCSINLLQEKLETVSAQVSECQSIIQKQNQLIANLNQQNILLIDIKSTLTAQNHNFTNSYHQIHQKYLVNQNQISRLHTQLQYLIKDITNLEQLLDNKNDQIFHYERFLSSKHHQIQPKHHSIQPNHHQIQPKAPPYHYFPTFQQLASSIKKYKKKALKYRQERDQLLAEIQQAKIQIGTITLRDHFYSHDASLANN